MARANKIKVQYGVNRIHNSTDSTTHTLYKADGTNNRPMTAIDIRGSKSPTFKTLCGWLRTEHQRIYDSIIRKKDKFESNALCAVWIVDGRPVVYIGSVDGDKTTTTHIVMFNGNCFKMFQMTRSEATVYKMKAAKKTGVKQFFDAAIVQPKKVKVEKAPKATVTVADLDAFKMESVEVTESKTNVIPVDFTPVRMPTDKAVEVEVVDEFAALGLSESDLFVDYEATPVNKKESNVIPFVTATSSYNDYSADDCGNVEDYEFTQLFGIGWEMQSEFEE